MADKELRRISSDKAATREEFQAAIAGLTDLELRKLRKAARYRIRGLGRKVGQRDWEDLLQETILAFLRPDGRKWKKDEVDILRTLNQAMRSIADGWRRACAEDEVRPEAELVTTLESGELSNPLDSVADPDAADPQKRLEDLEKIAKIAKMFEKRELASLIFSAMREDLSGPDIKEMLEIDQKAYETEMTWMRRKVDAAFKVGVKK